MQPNPRLESEIFYSGSTCMPMIQEKTFMKHSKSSGIRLVGKERH
jgi:hypothetical protein